LFVVFAVFRLKARQSDDRPLNGGVIEVQPGFSRVDQAGAKRRSRRSAIGRLATHYRALDVSPVHCNVAQKVIFHLLQLPDLAPTLFSQVRLLKIFSQDASGAAEAGLGVDIHEMDHIAPQKCLRGRLFGRPRWRGFTECDPSRKINNRE
jgi:hypothetical protein